MERRQLKELQKAVSKHDWKKVQEIAEDLLYQTCIQTRIKRKDWLKFKNEFKKSIGVYVNGTCLNPEDRKVKPVQYPSIAEDDNQGFKRGEPVLWNHNKQHRAVEGYIYLEPSSVCGQALIRHITRSTYSYVPYSELTKDDGFRYGQLVWDKKQKCIIGFDRHLPDGKIAVKNGVVTVVYEISDIEPYTGQDKNEDK